MATPGRPRTRAASRATRATRARAARVLVALVVAWCGFTPARALGFGPGFVENQGEFPASVRYAASIAGGTLYVTAEGLVFDLGDLAGTASTGEPGTSRRVALGVSLAPSRRGELDMAPGAARTERYRWITGRPPARVIEAGVFEDLSLRAGSSRRELRLEVAGGQVRCRVGPGAPGAAPWTLDSLDFRGADAVIAGGRAGARLETSIGTLTCGFEEDGGAGGALITFRWNGRSAAGAAADARAGSGAPRDPASADLILGTFLGGSGSEQGSNQVALMANGDLALAGCTRSPDFPVTLGVYDADYHGLGDAFVAVMDSAAVNLEWCTFIGGSGWDQATALAIGPAGELLVAGFTESADFPVTGAPGDTTFGGTRDAFVCAVDATGSGLLWSGYLGGGGIDEAHGIALSGARVFVTGYTSSPDFPTTSGAFRMVRQGGADAFVARIERPSGTLEAATYLGGANDDRGLAVQVAGAGPVISGETLSPGFPVTAGGYDRFYNGGADAFVCQLDSALANESWGTFLGGSDWDQAAALAIGPGGKPLVAGFTWSTNWPTTAGAFDRVPGGARDGFVARLAPDGSALEWSTYLGGGQSDACWGLAADSLGNVVITGETRSVDYPVTSDAFDPVFGGDWDAVVTRLRAAGDSLAGSSYLGGERVDVGTAVALDIEGDPVIAGWTMSAGFPWHSGCYDTTQNGDADLFLVKFGPGELTEVAPSAGSPASRAGVAGAIAARPNPFRGSSRISLGPGVSAETTIELIDLSGRLVRRAVPSGTAEGGRTWVWDGRDQSGREVPPGVYLARTTSPGRGPSPKLALKLVRLR